MQAPLDDASYPVYMQRGHLLLAFKAKDKMFKIEQRGSNTNDGVTIDYYTTRSMVIKHWVNYPERRFTPQEFKETLTKLYGAYIEKIIE